MIFVWGEFVLRLLSARPRERQFGFLVVCAQAKVQHHAVLVALAGAAGNVSGGVVLSNTSALRLYLLFFLPICVPVISHAVVDWGMRFNL